MNEVNKLRIIESLNSCSEISDGIIFINEVDSNKEYIFSTKYACPYCGYSVGKLEPKLFSFNSPAGACERCDGLGIDEFFDENKIIENPELSLNNGAIAGWDKKNLLYKVIGDFKVQNNKIIEDIGWYPRYNLELGIKNTCFWYKTMFKIHN